MFFVEYFRCGNKRQIVFFLCIYHRLKMTKKKRSKEEFEAYLKAILSQDYPKVKYSRPDAWRKRALKKIHES